MAPPLSRVQRDIALQPGLAKGSLLRLVRRIRVQLGGAILLCVLWPALIRWAATESSLGGAIQSSLGYAGAGTLLALVAGYVVLRQFITFPGVKATSYILPSFGVSYAAAALVFFFVRIDYSRWQFAASFILAVVWFHLIDLLMCRYAQPRLALVPGGNDKEITRLSGADWVRLFELPLMNISRFDGFVADLRAGLAPEWERFLARVVLDGWPVYDVKQVAESLTGQVEIEHLSENSFGSVLPSLIYLRLKRIVDMSAAILILPLFVLIIALAAFCVRFESPGPALFKQQRMGFRARVFTCYKLRSMRTDIAGAKFTVNNDCRITKVGQFIRRYRIDEFPQIYNILKGEMSWIGPRPEALELAQWYESAIPFYSYRHAVRPGLTGWAQVNQGNVAEVSAATSKLHYDFYYIKHFSPWLDLLIIIKTIRTVITGFGAR
jgi:lipopolysaccharide/colanic/teichoic acid biosynthesis glycosyltransferase